MTGAKTLSDLAAWRFIFSWSFFFAQLPLPLLHEDLLALELHQHGLHFTFLIAFGLLGLTLVLLLLFIFIIFIFESGLHTGGV